MCGYGWVWVGVDMCRYGCGWVWICGSNGYRYVWMWVGMGIYGCGVGRCVNLWMCGVGCGCMNGCR